MLLFGCVSSLYPLQIVTQLQSTVDSLVSLLSQSKVKIREISSFGLGIIVSSSSLEFDKSSETLLTNLVNFIDEEIKSVSYRNIDKLHGFVIALATIISRLYIRQNWDLLIPQELPLNPFPNSCLSS